MEQGSMLTANGYAVFPVIGRNVGALASPRENPGTENDGRRRAPAATGLRRAQRRTWSSEHNVRSTWEGCFCKIYVRLDARSIRTWTAGTWLRPVPILPMVMPPGDDHRRDIIVHGPNPLCVCW
eukprot:scaffold2799_cov408-Prasinococcus_capsulatus_cf.AAC.19